MLEKKKGTCYFCEHNIGDIDYKDTHTLRKFTSIYKKIMPRKKTGVCSWHQKKLSVSIKRSRTVALLPFTNK